MVSLKDLKQKIQVTEIIAAYHTPTGANKVSNHYVTGENHYIIGIKEYKFW